MSYQHCMRYVTSEHEYLCLAPMGRQLTKSKGSDLRMTQTKLETMGSCTRLTCILLAFHLKGMLALNVASTSTLSPSLGIPPLQTLQTHDIKQYLKTKKVDEVQEVKHIISEVKGSNSQKLNICTMLNTDIGSFYKFIN